MPSASSRSADAWCRLRDATIRLIEGWEPHGVVEIDMVTAGAALALNGLLEAPTKPPVDGDPLPLLWHWLAFLPRAPQSEIGSDGHPRSGCFLPPVALPQRRFAGARLRVQRPLTVGARLTRRGIVASIRNTQGRSGDLCFVTVRYEVTDDRGGRLEEEQDIVYRSDGRVATPPRTRAMDRAKLIEGSELSRPYRGFDLAEHQGKEAAAEWPCAREVEITPTLLFRFSALTYNAHRIHYDRDYARDIEGYPGLVVQGPLQAILLADLCRREGADRLLNQFSFLARTPAFDGGAMRFRGRREHDRRVSLQALDVHGSITMIADGTLFR